MGNQADGKACLGKLDFLRCLFYYSSLLIQKVITFFSFFKKNNPRFKGNRGLSLDGLEIRKILNQDLSDGLQPGLFLNIFLLQQQIPRSRAILDFPGGFLI